MSLRQLLRRRGALVALAAALSTGAALLVQTILGLLAGWLPALVAGVPSAAFYDLGTISSGVLAQFALSTIPLVLGVFLSYWIVAPIAAELRLGHVIARSILALGIGSTLAFVALAIVFTAEGLVPAAPGALIPVPSFDGPSVVQAVVSAFQSAANQFVEALPLAILVGVLTWIWLERHPPEHAVAGVIDEV